MKLSFYYRLCLLSFDEIYITLRYVISYKKSVAMCLRFRKE